MAADIKKAVASSLGYITGLRTVGDWGIESETQAFLEHLAGQGFIVRRRDGAERVRLKPEPLDKHRVSGAEIRAMRLALNLSASRLAKRAGINQETLARIESGLTSPQVRTLSAILNALASAQAERAGRR